MTLVVGIVSIGHGLSSLTEKDAAVDNWRC